MKKSILIFCVFCSAGSAFALEANTTPLFLKCNDINGKKVVSVDLEIDTVLIRREDYYGIPYDKIFREIPDKAVLKELGTSQVVNQPKDLKVLKAQSDDVDSKSDKAAKAYIVAGYFGVKSETPDTFSLKLEVPGLDEKSVEISVENFLGVYYHRIDKDGKVSDDESVPLSPWRVAVSEGVNYGAYSVMEKRVPNEKYRNGTKYIKVLCNLSK